MARIIATIKKLKWKLAAAITIVIVGVLAVNLYIIRSTDSRLHAELSSLPYNDVGLVLGVSKFPDSSRTG